MKYAGNRPEEMETDFHRKPEVNLRDLIEPLLEDPDDFLPQNLDKMCEVNKRAEVMVACIRLASRRKAEVIPTE